MKFTLTISKHNLPLIFWLSAITALILIGFCGVVLPKPANALFFQRGTLAYMLTFILVRQMVFHTEEVRMENETLASKRMGIIDLKEIHFERRKNKLVLITAKGTFQIKPVNQSKSALIGFEAFVRMLEDNRQ